MGHVDALYYIALVCACLIMFWTFTHHCVALHFSFTWRSQYLTFCAHVSSSGTRCTVRVITHCKVLGSPSTRLVRQLNSGMCTHVWNFWNNLHSWVSWKGWSWRTWKKWIFSFSLFSFASAWIDMKLGQNTEKNVIFWFILLFLSILVLKGV